MDPLSITLSVVSLLKTCSTVYTTLKDLYDGAASADTRVTALLTEVGTFLQVIQLLKDTLERDQVRNSLQSTGHIGSHWNNLTTLLLDCETILAQLQETLEAVNKSVSVLNGPRKHFRLKSAFGEIGVYQQQIRSYRDTLQLSLQTAILWNQVTFRESTDQILPNLDELYQTIRKIATDISNRMTSLENAVDTRSDDDQLLKLSNQRECVRSAASIVSSASTTLGVALPNTGSSSYGSDFGDVLPSEPSEAMLRWISSNTVYEFEHDEHSVSTGKTEAPLPIGPELVEEDSQASQSDSDNDLEMEVIHSVLKRANQSLDAQDFDGARRLFLNCINRISRNGSTISKARKARLHGEIMGPLLLTYEKQEKWEEAHSFLLKKISAAGSRGVDDQTVFSDMLSLVEVLIHRKSYAEALLYGRRAFKGYRKLGPAGAQGAEKALVLIVRVCDEDGNHDDRDAYAATLSDFQDRKQKTHAPEMGNASKADVIPKSVSMLNTANTSQTASTSTAIDISRKLVLSHPLEKSALRHVPSISVSESALSFDLQPALDDRVVPIPHILDLPTHLRNFSSHLTFKDEVNGSTNLQDRPPNIDGRFHGLEELIEPNKQASKGGESLGLAASKASETFTNPSAALPANGSGSMPQLSLENSALIHTRRESTDHWQSDADAYREYLHHMRDVEHESKVNGWGQIPRPMSPKDTYHFPPSPHASKSSTSLPYPDTSHDGRGPWVERLGKIHSDLKPLREELYGPTANSSTPKTIRNPQLDDTRNRSAGNLDPTSRKEYGGMQHQSPQNTLIDIAPGSLPPSSQPALAAPITISSSSQHLTTPKITSSYTAESLQKANAYIPAGKRYDAFGNEVEASAYIPARERYDAYGNEVEVSSTSHESYTLQHKKSPTFDDLLPRSKVQDAGIIWRKVVVVGDGCGKTAFANRLKKGAYEVTGLPTPFDILHFQVEVNPAIFVDMEWHDTGGIEDYDRLRPLQYPGAHLFLICFAIDSPDSLDNVQEKWISEVQHFAKGTPFMLIGLLKDSRYDPKVIAELNKTSQHPVQRSEAEVVAQKIGAHSYMECSAKTGEGCQEILKRAASLALWHWWDPKPKKKRNLLGRLVGKRFN